MDIKRKKYDLIFRLSFVSYVLILIASPYVTAQTWADIILLIFIMTLVYQFVYIFFLRKKYNKKFSNVFFRFLLYGMTSVSVYIIIGYFDNFINGYTPTDWVGNKTHDTYYGIQAILEDDWKNIFCVPYLIFNLLIIIVFKFINKKLEKNKKC